MKIIICDDDKNIINSLSSIIKSIDDSINIIVFNSWFSLCDCFENSIKNDIDAIFMDIEFHNSDKNGIYYANEVLSYLPNIKIIFMTGYSEKYIEDIYLYNTSLKPFGFIKKPFCIEKIAIYIEQLKSLHNTDNIKYLEFKTIHNGTVYINLDTIKYISSNGRYVNVYTTTTEYKGYNKLQKIFQELQEKSNVFYYCHKSYIINLNFITAIKSNMNCINIGNDEIPISRINGTSIGEKKKDIIKIKAMLKGDNILNG